MSKKKNDAITRYEFAGSIRGQYIISQALYIAANHLKKLESRNNPYPKNGEHAEPSNRSDMEYLLDIFPMYNTIREAELDYFKKGDNWKQLELIKGDA